MSQTKVKLLFPTDFSDFASAAFSTCQYLAKVYDAEVFVLHVIEAPTGAAKLFSNFDEDDARKKALKYLDDFINNHGDKSIQFNKMVKVGKAYRSIVEAASEIVCNAIVMSTHGASGVKEVLVGSTASRVIRSAPCHVLTIRQAPEREGFKKIVLPLDLTQETAEKINLGIEFAHNFDAELIVLSVLQTTDEEIKKRLERRLELAVDHIKKNGIQNVTSFMHISKHPIPEVVVEYAQNNKADMICIMTQKELNFKEQFLGSNAEWIVNHSPIPVMAVKPKREYKKKQYASAVFN